MPLSFLSICLVTRHVIGTQNSHFLVIMIIFHYAALGENMTFLRQVSVSIMSRSLPQLPLQSPPNLEVYHNFTSHPTSACDCPCDDLVVIETPPRSVMALSYIAQALVVTIIGLNMGFRWCVGVSYMRGAGGEGPTGPD